MPKKPKTDKRLDKLFKDFQPEETASKLKSSPKVKKDAAPLSNPRPVRQKSEQAAPSISRKAALASYEPVITQQDEFNTSSYSVNITTGLSEWSTLRIMDETNERTWTTDEQLLIKQVSDQLSLALENAHLFQETQKSANELATLNEIVQAISEQIELKDVLKTAYEKISKIIPVDAFFVALYDETSQMISYPVVIDEGMYFEEPDGPLNPETLSGKTILSGKLLFETIKPEDVDRTITDNTTVGNAGKSYGTLLFLPLRSGAKTIGCISIQSYDFFAYKQDDVSLLENITNQISIGIQNAQLYNDAKRTSEELAVLNSLSKELTKILSVNEISELALKYTSQLMAAKSFFICLMNQEKQEMIYPLFLDEGERIEISPRKPGNGLSDYVIRTNQSLFMPDRLDERMQEMGFEKLFAGNNLAPKSWMGVPMSINDRVLGAVVIQSIQHENLHNKHDLELLLTIAQQTAVAFENARLFQETERSEADLRALFSSMEDVVLVVDKDGRYVRIAPTNPSRLIRPPEELVGQLMHDVMLKEVADRFVAGIQETLKNSETVQLEYDLQVGDERFWFLASLSKLDEQNVFWVARDITERKKSEEELRKSQEQYALAAEGANDGLWDWDILKDDIYYSPRWKSMIGYGEDELTKGFDDWERLIHPEDHDYAVKALNNYLSGEADTYNIEIRLQHKDGTWRWIQDRGKALRDAEGKAIRMAGSHSDITERKNAEESIRRRNEYLAASSEIGKIVTSTLDVSSIFARTVTLINERFGFYHAAIFIVEETGFNAALQEATGEAGAEMKKNKYLIQVNPKSVVGKVTLEGRAVVVNNALEDPLHKLNPLLPETRAEAAIPLRIGNRVIGAIDIQAQTINAFSEDEITVLQTLADQIAVAIDNARSYELSQQAVMEMREIDRLKSQFLANMSHELRTPLNSIIGFSRVILKGIDGPVTELQQQDLTAIYNSGQHLLSLINDILDLSKIEAGKMELAFDEVNIADITNSVLSTMSGLVKDKPVELKRIIEPDLPTVRADAIRVRQVMINLLSNASKFTDEGDILVEVGLKPGPTGRNEIQISVTDTGPGISQQDQEKLFQPFSQVDDSPTRKTGGTGLGLSICQHLVDMHGGRIWIESEVGKGSSFFFTLPLFRKEKEAELITGGNKIILTIDDDPQVISLYERYLQPQGYQVIPLSDPTRAVERARQLKPFAITLDIMMPGVDGWQILDTLKGDPDTRHIPVIVCSIIEDLEKGFSLGAADYLVKPILEDDLVNALDRLNSDGSIREVLVIDDDPNDLRLIGKILDDDGRYKAILAEGGKNGWSIISSGSPPHAVILDLFMPEMDGFTILENMRAEQRLRDIPVIVISGMEPSETQKNQLSELGQRLLSKGSFSEKELLTTIQRTLDRARTNNS